MRDTGLDEFVSGGSESKPAVEARRMSLRVQYYLADAPAARLLQQRPQQRGAYAHAPPGPKHGHAPDAPVGKQTGGSNRV